MLNDETVYRIEALSDDPAQETDAPVMEALKAMGCKRPEEEIFIRPESLGLEA